MSIFGKLKASAGIGNAKVDAQVLDSQVKQGGLVTGEVLIVGGAVDQEINAVYISVVTSVTVERDDKKYTQDAVIQRVSVSDAFTITAGEEKVIPFSFKLSPETPVTSGKTEVWLKTALDVSFAIDPKDKDFLNVKGSEAVEAVLEGARQLGFTLKKATNLQSRRTQSGVVQEFEYYPGGDFKRHFSELELVFVPDEAGVTVYIEVDHKAKGLGGLLAQALDMDESRTSVRILNREVSGAGAGKVAEQLRSVLLKAAR